jgi:uncharacterized membrane protein
MGGFGGDLLAMPAPALNDTLAIVLWILFGLMAYKKKLFKFPVLGDLAEIL